MKCYCCRVKTGENAHHIDILKIRHLFKSVLVMAGRDAFLLSAEGKLNKRHKQDALNFLKGGDDLKMVCELADVDDQQIVALMTQKVNNNLKYRKFILIVKTKQWFG